jgi:hypothetical protein
MLVSFRYENIDESPQLRRRNRQRFQEEEISKSEPVAQGQIGPAELSMALVRPAPSNCQEVLDYSFATGVNRLGEKIRAGVRPPAVFQHTSYSVGIVVIAELIVEPPHQGMHNR